ncbi:ATP-binding protein [Chrysiogenes arsenatis]|uniref:ATP-binding protein n=1 Tax=Chrysiogenes arsenatis TaxID=309797 RepID=UPI0006846730|nr:ATP-binding protein [Chrysiogenes arsenatis]
MRAVSGLLAGILDIDKRPVAPVPCPACGVDMGWRPFQGGWLPNEYCRCVEPPPPGVEELLGMCGVPLYYVKKRLADLIDHNGPLRKVVVYCEGSLLLYGLPGTGKTHIVAGLLRRELENNRVDERRAMFVVVPDMLAEIREGIRDSTMERRIQRITSIPLLILDDLGAEKPSDFARETLYRIINHRYNNHLRTWITSNMALDKGLEAHLGLRLCSRLSEMCTVIFTGSKDWRKCMRSGGSASVDVEVS